MTQTTKKENGGETYFPIEVINAVTSPDGCIMVLFRYVEGDGRIFRMFAGVNEEKAISRQKECSLCTTPLCEPIVKKGFIFETYS